MRAGALAALAVALLNPRWFQPSAALDVIFAVDLSRSVGQEGREKAREVMEVAAGLKKVATRTGLMSFGSAPEWELPPREEIAATEFSARLDREQTDIQAALQGAAAQMARALDDGARRQQTGETARVSRRLRQGYRCDATVGPCAAAMSLFGGFLCRARSTALRASRFAARSKAGAKRRRGCVCCVTACSAPSANCV
jgi:hypothetical protein